MEDGSYDERRYEKESIVNRLEGSKDMFVCKFLLRDILFDLVIFKFVLGDGRYMYIKFIDFNEGIIYCKKIFF